MENIFRHDILNGKIFVYPTDTIYGLGCNALDGDAVNKIKKMKHRDGGKPISVIAPSINWVRKNCFVDSVDLEKYLPGPYTLILKKKKRDFLVECSKGETIGVRIPNHIFVKEIEDAGVPFVTTSVNLSGEESIHNVDDLPGEILHEVDIIIDVGEIDGCPSTLIVDGKEILRK